MASTQAIAAIKPYEQHFSRPIESVAADLEHYARLLEKWQKVQNLVSRETLGALWTRHMADSLQVLKLLQPGDRSFLDLGSGGGFPALPMAIALKGTGAKFRLVEPIGRKASFLRTVARELDLAVTVENARIEQIDSRETEPVQVITSRALASLDVLCGWMAPFFASQTRALLHKGREFGEEVRAADSHWAFDVVEISSDTDAQAVLLDLRNLRARNPV